MISREQISWGLKMQHDPKNHDSYIDCDFGSQGVALRFNIILTRAGLS